MKKKICFATWVVSIGALGMLVSCGPIAKNPNLIYFITDIGNIDDKSFNQAAWEGIQEFAKDNDKEAKYLRPTENSTAARLEMIEAAHAQGSSVIVFPGFLFQESAYIAQQDFKDMSFIYIDSVPTKDNDVKIAENTVSLVYDEMQSGWLAGYFAAKEYDKGINKTTKLGYFGGMGVAAVLRYGYGFCAGVEYYAKVTENSSNYEINYTYCGSFAPDASFVATTEGWYDSGVDCIFSCGGAIYLSVLTAAKNKGKTIIGVDSDQGLQLEEKDKPYMLTSAMKGVKPSTIDALDVFYKNDGKLPEDYGGKAITYSAAGDGVSLGSKETWNFKNSTYEEYETLFEVLKTSDKDNNTDHLYKIDESKAIDQQGFKNVTVNYIK